MKRRARYQPRHHLTKTPPPAILTVTIGLDSTGFQEAMAQLQRSVNLMTRRYQETQRRLAPAWRSLARLADEWTKRHEVMVSGLEARYYAQGSLLGPLEVCRAIRRSQWQMDLTDAEVIRLQVAACSGAARAWSAR